MLPHERLSVSLLNRSLLSSYLKLFPCEGSRKITFYLSETIMPLMPKGKRMVAFEVGAEGIWFFR
jgi:hypothetical protein